MILSRRQRAVLLYGSTIFGAFSLILLLIITIFTKHFYTLNVLDAGIIERYKTMFTGIGILFIPAGLFFAYAIGWIISRELYPRNEREDFAIDREITPVEDPKDMRYDVHSTISHMQAAYEQIQNFSANASHELRTPLTIMRGEIELALRHTKSAEEYQHLLGSLLEEIMRLARILDDLLLIAKTEIGERPLSCNPWTSVNWSRKSRMKHRCSPSRAALFSRRSNSSTLGSTPNRCAYGASCSTSSTTLSNTIEKTARCASACSTRVIW